VAGEVHLAHSVGSELTRFLCFSPLWVLLAAFPVHFGIINWSGDAPCSFHKHLIFAISMELY
jgi:hypothetical protein